MIKDINKLSVFFEDCYREFSVREYSREVKVSPPTSSKILKGFTKDDLLLMREDSGFLLFKVNQESFCMKYLSKIYWSNKLNDFISYIDETVYPNSIVLFGSFSRLEVKKESNIDIMILGGLNKDVDLTRFEKKLNRTIKIYTFDSLDKIDKKLRNNVINGFLLNGYLK